MRAALEKVLADLDGLGDSAIQKRILGLGAEEEAPSGEHPIAETAEKAVAEAVGEPREEPEEDEQIDPALLEKLREALSK